MGTITAMKTADVVREDMRRHRAATPVKRPVHPGVTQKEAGLTPEQAERLVLGACDDLAPVRGVMNGLTLAAVIWLALLFLGLLAVALQQGGH